MSATGSPDEGTPEVMASGALVLTGDAGSPEQVFTARPVGFDSRVLHRHFSREDQG